MDAQLNIQNSAFVSALYWTENVYVRTAYCIVHCSNWSNSHGTGRRIENASEGITLQIEKKAESAGDLSAYIYLIMDAQLNIQNSAFVSVLY